ncbi:MAG TPA: hypothetical protein VJX67_22130, partial [Blastocatellia bacterium]|nr:hypothetical protein [Blastocatellia bacterium]
QVMTKFAKTGGMVSDELKHRRRQRVELQFPAVARRRLPRRSYCPQASAARQGPPHLSTTSEPRLKVF